MGISPDILGIGVVFLGLMGSRYLYSRAIKSLPAEYHAQLATVLVHLRWVVIAFYLFLFMSFFGFQKFGLLGDRDHFVYFIVALGAGVVGFTLYNTFRLRKAGLPSEFIKSYNISNAMRMIGIIGFIVIIYYSGTL